MRPSNVVLPLVAALAACSGSGTATSPVAAPEAPAPVIDETYAALQEKLGEGEVVVKCDAPDRPDERELLDSSWKDLTTKNGTLYGIAPIETGTLWFKAPWNGPWDAIEVFWDARGGEDDTSCIFQDRQFAALVATPSSPPQDAHISAQGCEDILGGHWPVTQKNNPVLRFDTNLTEECSVQVLAWRFEKGKDPVFARGPSETVTPIAGVATPLALEPPKDEDFQTATEEQMTLFTAQGGKLPSDAK